MQNFLDKAIAYVSPSMARQRAAHRAAIKIQQRGYAGAVRDDKTSDWISSGASANTEILSGGALLKNRSRELVRNDWMASRIMSVYAESAIGTGIMWRANTGDAKLDKKLNSLWSSFVDAADADGMLDFYGMQALAVRSMMESGDVLARFIPRRLQDGLDIPLQIQLLENDFLADSYFNAMGGPNTNIMGGIEFDLAGKRLFYHLYKNHPGENYNFTGSNYAINRIPASEVVHLYRATRPGQMRGVPILAPVMAEIKHLAELRDANLIRKKLESCFVGIITQPEAGDFDATVACDNFEHFEPGRIQRLKAGQDIKFNAPNTTASDFDYSSATLGIAAGAGIPYMQMTGDLSQANYSSMRSGEVAFRRAIEQLRWHCIIPMFCRPIHAKFIAQIKLAGLIPSKAICNGTWIPPKFEWVDPIKDIQAELLATRGGLQTVGEMISKQGYDPQTQIEEIALWNSILDKNNVQIAADARSTFNPIPLDQKPKE